MVKSVILAAGKGTRMKSDKPKVVHQVMGKPMVYYSIEAARQAGADEVKQIAFAGRQGIDALLLSGHCGGWNNGGVVADFAVIHNPFGMRVQFQGGCER